MERYEIVQKLHKKGFYKQWPTKKLGPIIFHIYPTVQLENNWFKKRLNVYKKNAKILEIKKLPQVNFYIYPSKEYGEKLGFHLSFAFTLLNEIHSKPDSTSGHELTHLLLNTLNNPENLPASGIWSEGIATYLSGNKKINFKQQFKSSRIKIKDLNTPWETWTINTPWDVYLLVASIIHYLVRIYGWKKIINFLKQQKQSGSNQNEIAQKIFKKSLNQLQINWSRWINKILIK